MTRMGIWGQHNHTTQSLNLLMITKDNSVPFFQFSEEGQWGHHLDPQVKDQADSHHLVDRGEDHQQHHLHHLFQPKTNKHKHLQSIQEVYEDAYLDIPTYG